MLVDSSGGSGDGSMLVVSLAIVGAGIFAIVLGIRMARERRGEGEAQALNRIVRPSYRLERSRLCDAEDDFFAHPFAKRTRCGGRKIPTVAR